MDLHLKEDFSRLGDEIVRAASSGDSASLALLLENQRDFVRLHRSEMDEVDITTLGATMHHALRSAKIRRAFVLDAIQSNTRSIGVLRAYLTAQES